MAVNDATDTGEKTSWFLEELARAKARNEAIPEQARMVVVGPGLTVPTGEQVPDEVCAFALHRGEFCKGDRRSADTHATACPSYLTLRRIPVQGEATNCRRGPKPYGSVTWAEHEKAWTEYHRKYWEQDARRIAERGGFGYWEITDLLGHEPETWLPGGVTSPRPLPRLRSEQNGETDD